jgi:hypothetical protein
MKAPTKPLREKRLGLRGNFTAVGSGLEGDGDREHHPDQNLLLLMDHKMC